MIRNYQKKKNKHVISVTFLSRFFCFLLEPSNVISILISSEFLKMDSLVSTKKD